MNRSWIPTAGHRHPAGDSRSIADTAVQTSDDAARNASGTEQSKFKQSFSDASRTDVPFSGFSPSVAIQRRPTLSATAKAKLGLVGTGGPRQVANSTDLQGGDVTGTTVPSWQNSVFSLFTPTCRGPAKLYSGDDPVKRHADREDAVGSDEDSVEACDDDWREFDAPIGSESAEEVLICGDASLNNFRIQNVADEHSEAHVGSMEDLTRLLCCVDESVFLKTIKHLSLKGAEVPLWALAVLFGRRGDVPQSCAPLKSTVDTGSASERPAAGSASAAAAAILSFRVSQSDVRLVEGNEQSHANASKRVLDALQSRLRTHLLSLDLSAGALEPRYAPLNTIPRELDAHFKFRPERLDSGVLKVSSPAASEQLPEDDDASQAFASESTALTAALLLFRDALQPTKVRVPFDREKALQSFRDAHDAMVRRQARERRERAAEARGADEGDADDADAPDEALTEQETRLEHIEEELNNYPARADEMDPTEDVPQTDEQYDEETLTIRQNLHKWMDVPPVLANLQALSLSDNPSLFLDTATVFEEGAGSIETLTEPNVPALEALRSVLQQSGPSHRYAADFATFHAMQHAAEDGDGFFATSSSRYQPNRLATLLLANCGLNNPTAVRLLAEGLSQNTSLKKLSVANNNFGREDTVDMEVMQELCDAIGGHKSLEALDLSGNALSGEVCRMLAEAIAASFESHKKSADEDAVDEESDGGDDVAEERGVGFSELFEEIIPPPEEKPDVTVGFPPEAAEEAEAEDLAADEAVEEEEEDAGEGGEEDDDEEGAANGRPPRPQRVVADADASDAEDDDADEVSSEVARANHERELREAEREWRSKHRRYISIPERTLLNYSESVARRDIAISCHAALVKLKEHESKELRICAATEKERVEDETIRHGKGWSHLQILSLSRNPIGDEGAASLASMLRHTVPLSEEDQHVAAEEREKEVARLTKGLIKARRAELRQERLAAKEAAQDELLRMRAMAEDDSQPPPSGGETSRPDIPHLAVPAKRGSSMDSGEEEASDEEEQHDDGDGDDDAGMDEDDEVVEVTADMISLPVLPPLRDVRPGLRSLRHLDVSECRIGSKGMRALWEVVGDNCRSLKTLNLSRNTFGTRRVQLGSEEEDTVSKGDDKEWVSPGVVALGKGISLNTRLVSLDLSFNKLYPNAIVHLADALTENRTLKHLNLRGNFIGAMAFSSPTPTGGSTSALSRLLGAFVDESNGPSSLETLILDQNVLGSSDVFSSMDAESVHRLALLCHSSLDTLSLSENDLTDADMTAFSNALYATAMDKKTGLSLDGSMSAMGSGGRRGSITDMTDEERETSIAVVDGDAGADEPRMLGMRKSQAGTSFCVNTSATLRMFSVENNPRLCGESGGTSIARVVQFCSRLHQLSLGGCVGLGDSGFRLICLKVSSHPSLSIFSGPRTGITTLAPLTAALQTGSAPLTVLDFGDNDISRENLLEFSSAVCSMVTEALGTSPARPSGFQSVRTDTPIRLGEAPPVLESDDDEDDCPPPPFDPDEEDVTPAQSMQRQASRMAILAASTCNSPNPLNAKSQKGPVLKYVSLWGRRGQSESLPALESLVMNGIIEDYWCGIPQSVPSRGPVSRLFNPLMTLGGNPLPSMSVFGQVPSVGYYLHRSVFEGSYSIALARLHSRLASLRDREAPSAQIAECESELSLLSAEVISTRRVLGFLPSAEGDAVDADGAHVVSTPIVNALRHQLIHALIIELRLAERAQMGFLFADDSPPSLEDDEASRATFDKLAATARLQCCADYRNHLLSEALDCLNSLRDIQANAESATSVSEVDESPNEAGEDEVTSPPNDSGRDSAFYAREMKKYQRQLVAEAKVPLATASPQVSGSPPETSNAALSPVRRSTREIAVEAVSKQRVSFGALLLLLTQSYQTTSATCARADGMVDDTLRMMQWQCLMNRLAAK